MASQKSSSLRNRAYRGVTPRFAGWWVALGQGWQILLKHSCVIWKEPQTCEAGRQRYSIPLNSVKSTRGACQGEHTWQRPKRVTFQAATGSWVGHSSHHQSSLSASTTSGVPCSSFNLIAAITPNSLKAW